MCAFMQYVRSRETLRFEKGMVVDISGDGGAKLLKSYIDSFTGV